MPCTACTPDETSDEKKEEGGADGNSAQCAIDSRCRSDATCSHCHVEADDGRCVKCLTDVKCGVAEDASHCRAEVSASPDAICHICTVSPEENDEDPNQLTDVEKSFYRDKT